ncbi:hypothetical protein ACLBXB_28260, partial [Methylobacterium mesophilicum]
ESANRHHRPLTIGNATLGTGHGAPSSGGSESASYQAASVAVLEKKTLDFWVNCDAFGRRAHFSATLEALRTSFFRRFSKGSVNHLYVE